MNKTDLCAKISEVTEVSKKDVKAVVDALPDVIKEAVAGGDKVSLTGFITFDKKHVDAKTGVIQLGDKKGQTWETPEKDEVSVKISKSYKTI